MKIVLLAALVGSAAAFAPAVSRTAHMSSTTLSAAKSAAEDIEMTLKVIMDNMEDDNSGIDDSDVDAEDDTPAAPAPVAAAAPTSSGVELWSVDYSAAAKLAYAAAGSEGDFGAFQTKYLAETSAMVSKKGIL
mmetsp:Transcript_36995/g.64806  ORF Transcript_36995/g.64806 Transcript_36995/m.64806 type:complete len:133 (-) Transcript_36995:282-680(-)|eukprot:CAMPEP_0201865690 /NCGR_PEP_ID=MMETSP0902-20130614/509_1 /ASSEMBLY_ACC=CAM_ASM_000551 /TAXON_ID=420261 /ORGANISM="Thalassiosira antarctica, Strain CCMP982" /LENGTH=132 /DNA_ID=CAMNT_0048390511 /DNA_START=44 /DNA_END=442 /DNA_ORIENTATION=-